MKAIGWLTLLILLGFRATGQPKNVKPSYIEVNCDRAKNTPYENTVRMKLMSLKGDIKTLSQFHYVLVENEKGNLQERFDHGVYSFGYQFNSDRKILEEWSYGRPPERVKVKKYVNFRTGLRVFSSHSMKGDTVLQIASNGSTDYYVNEEVVKNDFPKYNTRTLYTTTEKGLESRTYVKGTLQELVQFDKNRNPQYILTNRLKGGDGEIERTVETTIKYDSRLNKISEETRMGTSVGIRTFEYENDLLTKEFVNGGESIWTRYSYDTAGNMIASHEHGVDFIHEYRYDKQGNWVERKIYEKQNSKTLKYVAVMRRVIEYW